MDRVKAHCDLCDWHTTIHRAKHRPAEYEAHRMSLLASTELAVHTARHHPEPGISQDCGA